MENSVDPNKSSTNNPDDSFAVQDVSAPTTSSRGRLSDDLLRGANEIATFLFGAAKERRKIYHLARTGSLPVFKLGAILCARKSSLMTWIEEQERISTSPDC